MRALTIAVMLLGGTMLTLPLLPGSDAVAQNRPGKASGSAKSSINRPKSDRSGAGGMSSQAGNANRNASYNNNNNRNNKNYNNRPNNNNNNYNNNRPGARPNNNVVVVNNGPQPPRGGYYNNGGYYGGGYNNNNYNDNDDDFLEFVGKTAAITAGVSVVSAVIGSVVKEKPSGDCQQQVANGQSYMVCNGVWYSPVQAGSQTNYQVVAPPVK